jgi:hypothetical protein
MLSAEILLTVGRAAVVVLMAQAGGATSAAPPQESTARQFAEPSRTGKERLGGKASDEQRVDNCKVPLDLRGPTPRPDDCADGASTSSQR